MKSFIIIFWFIYFTHHQDRNTRGEGKEREKGERERGGDDGRQAKTRNENNNKRVLGIAWGVGREIAKVKERMLKRNKVQRIRGKGSEIKGGRGRERREREINRKQENTHFGSQGQPKKGKSSIKCSKSQWQPHVSKVMDDFLSDFTSTSLHLVTTLPTSDIHK